MKAVTPKQMAELDKKTIAAGTPSDELMERAGEAAAKEILKKKSKGKILVLSGTGNNGGDGQVIARLLKQDGKDVTLMFPPTEKECRDHFTEDSKRNFDRLKDVPIIYVGDAGLESAKKEISEASVIVDSLLGTGYDTDRPLREPLPELIDAVNESPAYVVAVDIPSGLNGTNGQVGQAAVRADKTVIIQAPKTGEMLGDGPDCTGKPVIVDIGIDTDDPDIHTELLEQKEVGFPVQRKKNSHKYTYGRVLVVAGSKGMTGAGAMAVSGAILSGAGLVTAFVPEEVYPIAASIMPHEAMVKPYNYIVRPEDLAQIRTDMILFGPGLGRHMDYSGLLSTLMSGKIPLVIDADGLWHMRNILGDLKASKVPVVLTPHAGEFAMLLDTTVPDLMKAPADKTAAFAKEYGVTVVMKGYHTMIADPDGSLWFNTTGNPGMATAGAGDVLAGMIAGIAAQTHDLTKAAKAGVFYHGLAGDWYAARYGETTLTAGSILDSLNYVLK